MIVCKKCKVSKEKKEFTKDKNHIHGIRYSCKECRNKKSRTRYAADSEFRDKVLKRCKQDNDKMLVRALRNTKELSDSYVIASLRRGTSLTSKDIRKHPELIKAKRQIIKNIRKCRESRI